MMPILIQKKIILKELTQNSSFIENFTNDDMNKIRNVIYDSRRKVLPVIPKNIIEAHLSLENTNVITCKGEQFLILNDQVKNVVIFSCDTNLKMLCEVDSIYVDGTFKCCARFLTQMFTIHGSKNGNYIPLVICLLPDKITETYAYVFNQIINKCNRIGQTFLPKQVVIDFEMSIHIAVTKVWPLSHIIGCRFHLTQSWWRSIQTFGLVSDYNDSSSVIGTWLHSTFGLIFLEPEEVSDCFVEDLMEDCPIDDKLTKYCDYLTEHYISDDSTFPPKLWACNSSSLRLTTNTCESFHSHFNKNFNTKSPSIMPWLNIILQVQVDIYVKINSAHFF